MLSPNQGYKVDYDEIDMLFSQARTIRLKPADQFLSKVDPAVTQDNSAPVNHQSSHQQDPSNNSLGKRLMGPMNVATKQHMPKPTQQPVVYRSKSPPVQRQPAIESKDKPKKLLGR
jgi:hypothetical protein